MKIAVCSDLHLEFEDIILKNTQDAEVLILSGDIMIAQDLHDHPETRQYIQAEIMQMMGSRQKKALQFREFLTRCSFQFPHVIYIAGNHEFYHGQWKASLDHLREECAKFTNVYFLENDVRTIGDTRFIGATLWTDCNKGDPLTLHALGDMMNDFRVIRNDELGYTKLRPAHTAVRHRRSVEYISAVVEGKHDRRFVVVGHHAPTPMSTHPQYANQHLMNGGYRSDLSEFILDRPQIKLWTHGHTHDPFDYMVGTTRVVCNPRGYSGHDAQADVFELKFLEV
jgi:predicted phosphodiesterase